MGDEQESGFFGRYWIPLSFILLAIISISFASYFTFVDPYQCNTYACFQEKMSLCSNAIYINEESEASWKYQIIGKSGDECAVKVIMLQAKKGELELEKLSGYSMECVYPEGVSNYPEKDLGACSGKLKEELQGIVIKKLYTYIIENIGELNNSLRQFV